MVQCRPAVPGGRVHGAGARKEAHHAVLGAAPARGPAHGLSKVHFLLVTNKRKKIQNYINHRVIYYIGLTKYIHRNSRILQANFFIGNRLNTCMEVLENFKQILSLVTDKQHLLRTNVRIKQNSINDLVIYYIARQNT